MNAALGNTGTFQTQAVPAYGIGSNGEPDLTGEIKSNPTKLAGVISMTVGFVLLILSAALSLFLKESKWVPFLSCLGLILSVVSRKCGHMEMKEQRKTLEKENRLLAKKAQINDLARSKDVDRKPSWSKIKLAGDLLQWAGVANIFASGVVAFYPDKTQLAPLFMQIGWAVFVAGTSLESYRQETDKESKQKENVLLKKECHII